MARHQCNGCPPQQSETGARGNGLGSTRALACCRWWSSNFPDTPSRIPTRTLSFLGSTWYECVAHATQSWAPSAASAEEEAEEGAEAPGFGPGRGGAGGAASAGGRVARFCSSSKKGAHSSTSSCSCGGSGSCGPWDAASLSRDSNPVVLCTLVYLRAPRSRARYARRSMRFCTTFPERRERVGHAERTTREPRARRTASALRAS